MRAADAPSVSIFHAACSVISRAALICASESAIQFWIVCLSAGPSQRVAAHGALAQHVVGPPRYARASACSGGSARAEPVLGDQEPLALAAEQRVRRHAARPRSRSRRGRRRGRSAPAGAPSSGCRGRCSRPASRSARSSSTRAGSARASGVGPAITIRKSATLPLVVNHLWPLIDPVVAVAHAVVCSNVRIGARGVGLGHREAAPQVAGQQRVAGSAPSGPVVPASARISELPRSPAPRCRHRGRERRRCRGSRASARA